MEKIKVTRGNSIKYEIDGKSLTELAEYFKAASKLYPSDAYLDISSEDDYGSTAVTVTIYWQELETDEEFEVRKKRQTVQLQTEKDLYLKLKKKYEGDK